MMRCEDERISSVIRMAAYRWHEGINSLYSSKGLMKYFAWVVDGNSYLEMIWWFPSEMDDCLMFYLPWGCFVEPGLWVITKFDLLFLHKTKEVVPWFYFLLVSSILLLCSRLQVNIWSTWQLHSFTSISLSWMRTLGMVLFYEYNDESIGVWMCSLQ